MIKRIAGAGQFTAPATMKRRKNVKIQEKGTGYARTQWHLTQEQMPCEYYRVKLCDPAKGM